MLTDFWDCGGLTLAARQVSTKSFYHFPQQGGVRENKVKKPLVDLDKGSLQKQKWRSCECKQREKSRNIYSMLPINKRCAAACWEAGLYHKWWLQKGKAVGDECTLLSSSFLLPFISEQMPHGMERPSLWSVWVNYPGWVLSQVFDPPYPTGDGGTLEGQGWHHASAAQL